MSEKTPVSTIGITLIALVVSYGAFFLICMWTGALDNEWFWKLTITYGIVTVVLVVVYLIRREFGDDEKMKKDKYMD